jgi:hypothetical protein
LGIPVFITGIPFFLFHIKTPSESVSGIRTIDGSEKQSLGIIGVFYD